MKHAFLATKSARGRKLQKTLKQNTFEAKTHSRLIIKIEPLD